MPQSDRVVLDKPLALFGGAVVVCFMILIGVLASGCTAPGAPVSYGSDAGFNAFCQTHPGQGVCP